jgi:hypothetical protein
VKTIIAAKNFFQNEKCRSAEQGGIFLRLEKR